MMKKILAALFFVLLLSVAAVAAYGYFLGDAQTASDSATPTKRDPIAEISQGEYLARAGNCIGCHTVRGGAAYAGGRVIQSEFGDFVAPNITSDKDTGIGNWSADDFWRALHNGKSKNGRMLYPAFPYLNYSMLSRADSDAMFAYFKTVAAVPRQNQQHNLRFPFNQRFLLAFWRALYFRPAPYQEQAQQSAVWNRGAYLVNGLAHCSACHSSRNALGANGGSQDLSGGELAMINWYAPSLVSKAEAGLAHQQASQIQALLRSGVSDNGTVFGPMAEVVTGSLQYLSEADISAMSTYLQALPQTKTVVPDMLDKALEAQATGKEEMARIMAQGGKLYKDHCSTCHGEDGGGVAQVYPALKGNRNLQMQNVANPLRIILAGGFAPATKANPRPYGMPPFGPVLSDDEVALVLSYIRNAWGNQGAVISAPVVNPYRTAPLD
ncbi:MAG: c-type cytochrome [Pseudomonadota bacterium]